MPVTEQENEQYRAFVSSVAIELGVFGFGGGDVVWHYTNGDGFLGILQSSTLHATQVAALNDSKETEYATDLFKSSVAKLLAPSDISTEARAFLEKVLEFVKDQPENPTRGISKFFVTCFSGDGDDVNQWAKYARGNGYAIGFFARGLQREPTSSLYRVVYDREQQEQAALKLAEAALNFYLQGLTEARRNDPEKWAAEFFNAWDEWVYKLAPLAKDPRWKSENEYRIVHELKLSEFPRVRFTQKKTMLSRYIPLEFPCWVPRRVSLLPIAKVMIGPGNHPAFTRASVRLLLDQMGYSPDLPIEITSCTLTDV